MAIRIMPAATPERRSRIIFQEAQNLFPGGVNWPDGAAAPARGVLAPEPLVISRGKGAVLVDAEGHTYLDFAGCREAGGPPLLGYGDPGVVWAVERAAAEGLAPGIASDLERDLAKTLTKAFPEIHLLRLVNSPEEAFRSTVALAKAYTGRSGTLHCRQPLEVVSTRCALAKRGAKVAAVVVEPPAGLGEDGSTAAGPLADLAAEAADRGVLVIHDERQIGFRAGFTGFARSQRLPSPDLICLGYQVGGGYPLGAFGGRGEVMAFLHPAGPLRLAEGSPPSPLAVAAGMATLERLTDDLFYEPLRKRARRLAGALRTLLDGRQRCSGTRVVLYGSVLWLVPSETLPNLNAALRSLMLERGVLVPGDGSPWCVTAAHTDHGIETAIEAMKESLQEISL